MRCPRMPKDGIPECKVAKSLGGDVSFYFVPAHSGKIVLHFSACQIASAGHRFPAVMLT
jgi:hypothetical protein